MVMDTIDWANETTNPPAGSLTQSDLTVGTSAQELSTVTNQMAVALLADPANTGTIYVGLVSTVDSSNWPLAAGAYLSVAADVALWVIASAAGQVLHVLQAGQ